MVDTRSKGRAEKNDKPADAPHTDVAGDAPLTDGAAPSTSGAAVPGGDSATESEHRHAVMPLTLDYDVTEENTLIQTQGGVKQSKKALAKARVELAVARLALLEAEEENSDGDSTGSHEANTRLLRLARSSAGTPGAAGNNAAAPTDYHDALGTYAPGSNDTLRTRVPATEARRATSTPRVAVADMAPYTGRLYAGPPYAGPPQTGRPYAEPPYAGPPYAGLTDAGPPFEGAPTPEAAPPTPPRQEDNAGQTLKDLASALLEVARGGRPAVNRYNFDLPSFNGDCSEWLHFKTAYMQSAPSYSEHENQARLRKSLKGTALEAVKCLFLGSSSETILKRLESRFGRPSALITHELEKLRHLPKLTDNPRDVCIFASKINNVISTVQALNKPEYLYNPDMITLVTERLTTVIRARWYDFEAIAGDSEPGMITLGRFLDREAELNARHAKAEVVDDRRNRSSNDRFSENRQHKTLNVNVKETNCLICEGACSNAAACAKFKKMGFLDRWEAARKHKLCFRCLNVRTWKHRCKGKPCEAPGCKYYHHRLLHNDNGQQATAESGARSRTAEGTAAAVAGCTCTRAGNDCSAGTAATSAEGHTNNTTPSQHQTVQLASVATASAPRACVRTLLKVLPVTVTGPFGEMNTYALLDDGSTVSLATTEVAQRIGATGPNVPFYIEAIAGARIDASSSQRIKFTIRGKYVSEGIDIEARTIDKLDISAQSVPMETLIGCNHLTSIAEQLVYEEGVPTILIGQDNWSLLLSSEVLRGSRNQPVASRTALGWALHGQSARGGHALKERCGHVRMDTALEQLVTEHFSLESLGIEPRRPQADPEVRALRILQDTTRALPEGGYETGLLWKDEGKPFPDNYAATLSRLQGVEKRLSKDLVLKHKYAEQFKTMVDKGYAELAPAAPSSDRTWYLPHFPVLNPEKPGKVRIVHDAAARTHGVCLNDYLLTGPDLLQSLLGVLMRFRQKPVAIASDVQDMFLRISIRAQDRDALRFLWRDNPASPPIEYRMRTVLFGATSSPSTAIYIKNHNALRHQAEYPEAVDSIIKNHYMDDFLQSFDTALEANRVCRAVDAVHRRGNFVLHKWASNEPAAVADLATEPAACDIDLSEGKVLGLVWRHADDTLGFNLRKVDPSHLDKQPTKRLVLRTAMTLYDPLGLVTPVTVQAKRMLQDAWRLKVGWDERLPKPLEHKWHEWLTVLQVLKGVRIPRCYLGYSTATHLDLHVFVDASELVYAAAAYWRSVDSVGNVSISLAAAKGRAAPLKVTSVPRLELQAAVLGGRLARCVAEEHDRRADRRIFWSDSRTVLAWLRADARSFKSFVAHRVAELEETTAGAEWRWVPTADNVADDATRDVAVGFSASHRWFRGPAFLYDDEEAWPTERDPLTSTDTGEERANATRDSAKPRLVEALPDAKRFSSWLRLIRATARVLQFLECCRPHTTTATKKRTRRAAEDDPTWSTTKPRPARKTTHAAPDVRAAAYIPLAAQYTRRAELLWTRAVQEECFTDELRAVTGGRSVSPNSRLRQLSLEIDDHGLLTVHSRIAAAEGIARETLSPTLLDGSHYYCHLYIDGVHRRLHHSGVECVTNEVRQRFWILRLRPTVRTVIKRCQPCRLRRAAPPEPPTGNLPPCRLAHHQRPFTNTGVDYFGPLSVTVARHREKRYVALFTCLTTRAIHLEVAASLSTDAAILALRRMMARRGCPDTLWSDNGTNFHGSDAELRKAVQSLQQEADVRHINWRFIPPGAPFFGGAWERLVRSVKVGLAATLNERHPPEDVLHTLLTEVEHTINSRPLCHVSVAPEDDEALTPNHFLLGGPSKVPLPGTFTKVDEVGRSHWRASQRLADLFWQRWMREVLPTLQDRREPHGRGEAVKEGDVVIIVDANLPRNVWPKGRVERVYPGADGVVRVVDVRTKSGVMRRPTKRLVILPVDKSRDDE